MKTSIIKNNKFQFILATLFWLLVWEGIALSFNNALLLPTPIKTLTTLVTILFSPQYQPIIWKSIYRVLLGFILSLGIGFVLGLAGGLNHIIYKLLAPLVIAMKATPFISIIIIALLWFNASHVPIFVAFLMCFPIIYTSTVEGLKHIDSGLLEMAHIYHVKPHYIIKDIYIPSVKPYVYTGIKNTLGLSWKVTVASEVLSAPKYSIGYELFSAKTYLESEYVFAFTVLIVALSFIFEYGIKLILNKTG